MSSQVFVNVACHQYLDHVVANIDVHGSVYVGCSNDSAFRCIQCIQMQTDLSKFLYEAFDHTYKLFPLSESVLQASVE